MDKKQILNLVLGAILWTSSFWCLHSRQVESHWKLFWQTSSGILYLFLKNSKNEKIFAWHLDRNLCYYYYSKMTLLYHTVFSFCMSNSFTSYDNTSLKAQYLLST